MSWTRTLGALTVIALASPATAQAQDTDGDGVPNASDTFPCDATRASVSYFPSATTSAMIAYEDQWPAATDLDFNDVVLRVHYRLERNAAGNVVQLVAVIDPDALGGALSNGLGLQLPTLASGTTARRRIGGGAWQNLALEADTNATVRVSDNLRELFGNAQGRINSIQGDAQVAGQRLELEVSFAPAAALSVAAAPFDLFIFRAGDFPHQIHLPQYTGTQVMRSGLFNSGLDISSGNRRFVHSSGVPAALVLPTATSYPLEGVAIHEHFPEIVTFAATAGAQGTNFFASGVVPGRGRAVGAVAISPRVFDSSCVTVFNAQLAWSSATSNTVAPSSGVRAYGFVAIGSTADKVLFLRNSGSYGAASAGVALTGDTAHFRLVSVSEVSNAGSHSACSGGGDLAADGLSTANPCLAEEPIGSNARHLRVVVRYAPTAAGNHTVSLNVTPGNETVVPGALTLSGSSGSSQTASWSTASGSNVAPTGSNLDYGGHSTNTELQRSFYIRNTGASGALSVGVELSGDTSHFRIVSLGRVSNGGVTGSCNSGGAVATGGLSTSSPCVVDAAGGASPHVVVTIAYRPTAAGGHSVAVNLSSGNGGALPAAVTLIGTGLFDASVAWSENPSFVVPPEASRTWPTRTINTFESKTFYLRNVGNYGAASVNVSLSGDTAHFQIAGFMLVSSFGPVMGGCASGGGIATDGLATTSPCAAEDVSSGFFPHIAVNVLYVPKAVGTHTVSLNVSSGNGTVTPAPLVLTGSGQFNANIAWSAAIGSLVPPPSSVSVGATLTTFAFTDRTFYLRNAGTYGAASVNVSLSGDTAHFRLVSVGRASNSSVSSCVAGGGSIATGGLATSSPCLADDPSGGGSPHIAVTVRYMPMAVGTHSVSLNVSSGNGTVTPAPLVLTGSGQFNPNVAWSSAIGSLVAPSGADRTLPPITTNMSFSRTFYLRNVGTHGPASVNVSLSGDTAHFFLEFVGNASNSSTALCTSGGNLPFPRLATTSPCGAHDINGGSFPHIAVTVRYQPTAVGTHSVSLNVSSTNGTATPGPLVVSGSAL
jgi:LruC domain-containing protein